MPRDTCWLHAPCDDEAPVLEWCGVELRVQVRDQAQKRRERAEILTLHWSAFKFPRLAGSQGSQGVTALGSRAQSGTPWVDCGTVSPHGQTWLPVRGLDKPTSHIMPTRASWTYKALCRWSPWERAGAMQD